MLEDEGTATYVARSFLDLHLVFPRVLTDVDFVSMNTEWYPPPEMGGTFRFQKHQVLRPSKGSYDLSFFRGSMTAKRFAEFAREIRS